MTTQQVTVDFECWNCSKHNRQTVSVDTKDDTEVLNLRKRAVDVACDNASCGKINSVEIHV